MDPFLEQLYTDLIEPHIERQPKDALYASYFDDFDRSAEVGERDRADVIREFYAIHGFLLGLRMGHVLTESLTAPG